MTTSTRIQLSSLQIGKRHRAIDKFKVASLAKSMEAIGLQQPISVHAGADGAMYLIAGLHRVEAAKRLGWEHIAGIVVELDELDRELWEIDENLMRAELSAAEKRVHLKRRKELWEKRPKPIVAHDAPKSAGRLKGFAAQTAAETGLSKSQINRLLADDGEMPDIPPGLDRRNKKPKPADDLAEKIVAEPKPKETYRAPLSRKPKLEKHVGIDAARRHYLDRCGEEPGLDLDVEINLVTNALRELAGKRGPKANGAKKAGVVGPDDDRRDLGGVLWEGELKLKCRSASEEGQDRRKSFDDVMMTTNEERETDENE